MSIQRETYSELLHSMIFAWASQALTFSQITSVLYAVAQPDSTEETRDFTHEVREALTDWSELDKGMLIAIESVRMVFKCQNIHGPCEKGQHAVNLTRVIGSYDWEPEQVSSKHDFNDVIVEVTVPHVGDGTLDGKTIIHNERRRGAGPADLIGMFRDMFAEQPEQKMEREIDEFRKELDEWLPSAPNPQQEKGGSDESA